MRVAHSRDDATYSSRTRPVMADVRAAVRSRNGACRQVAVLLGDVERSERPGDPLAVRGLAHDTRLHLPLVGKGDGRRPDALDCGRRVDGLTREGQRGGHDQGHEANGPGGPATARSYRRGKRTWRGGTVTRFEHSDPS